MSKSKGIEKVLNSAIKAFSVNQVSTDLYNYLKLLYEKNKGEGVDLEIFTSFVKNEIPKISKSIINHLKYFADQEILKLMIEKYSFDHRIEIIKEGDQNHFNCNTECKEHQVEMSGEEGVPYYWINIGEEA